MSGKPLYPPPDASQADAASTRVLFILGPLLALGGFTVLLAVIAGLFGWQRTEMLMAAAGSGVVLLLLAIGLLYHQFRARHEANLALKGIEARVGGILDSAMDAIISVDETQSIVIYNRAAETMFGWPRPAALGQRLDMLIPARFRAGHARHVVRFGQTGATSRRMGEDALLWGVRQNGEEFPIDASISQHTEDARQFYTVIVRDVTRRVAAEKALRDSRQEIRDLAMATNAAREQEKTRVARELHDELAQALTALKMDVAWVRDRLPGDPAMKGKLSTMQALLDDTVAATRRISADLRPLMLDDLGLVPAVEWLMESFTQRTGIPCEFALGTPDLDPGSAQATAIFRILQESLTNIAKHAGANQVEVTLEQNADMITLTVHDNGRGFATQDPRKPNSYGLLGLRERAHLLDGRANVESEPGRGTIIEVHIPAGKPQQEAPQP